MNAPNTSGPNPEVRPLVQAYCYHDPDFYPPIINAIRLLCRAGFDVELYCRETGQPHQISYPPEAKVIRLDIRSKGSLSQFFAFLRATTGRARRDVAFFWGHDMHGFIAARLAAWRRRRPLVYHNHDYAEAGWMTAGAHVVHTLERCFARTADVIVIPDAARAAVIARDLGLHQLPLVAANAPLLTPLVRRHALRDTLHARGYRFDKVVFRQGKIGHGHGIEATIRSMPAWQRRDWGFVVMGLSDPGYVRSLEQLAHEVGVASQFVALPPVNYDEILHYTPDADVGHALYEQTHNSNIYIGTASNKAMEYLAAGAPLLVSPNKKLMELVSSGRCGAWADETDPASIAHAVNGLLGDEGKRAEMGRAARRAFETEFCYERQFAPVLERMRSLAISGR